ncbi:MAG TPA: response regulator transcription factor [Vicinamibacterales bacterium]|nr:response regulator transcription factor [Vicinamibacterales bacterium]
MIRVLCIDDHPLIRKGIASILSNEPDIELVGEGEGGRDALRLFRELQPDIALMDIRMRDLDGIQATKAIRGEFPDARIIALSSYDGDQDIYRAIEAGARGYLLKESAHTELVSAIRAVYAGKRLMPRDVAERLTEYFPHIALTARETQVLELVAKGMGNNEIADQLGTAGGTVKMHVQNILEKLGAADRTHAVAIAIRRGILHIS